MFQSRPVQAARRGRAASLLDDQRRERCVLRCSFHADVHTEAVQAALATYRERKVPLPSKRRSVLAHPSAEACTPPGTMAAARGPSDPRCPLRWETLACREDSEKPEAETRVCVRRPRRGSVRTQHGCAPGFCAAFRVFTKRPRVLYVWGRPLGERVPWAQDFASLSPDEGPLPGGSQASGGRAGRCLQGLGSASLLLLCSGHPAWGFLSSATRSRPRPNRLRRLLCGLASQVTNLVTRSHQIHRVTWWSG